MAGSQAGHSKRGLDPTPAAINAAIVVLPPAGLSRILGILVHLDIPSELPVTMLVAGLICRSWGWRHYCWNG